MQLPATGSYRRLPDWLILSPAIARLAAAALHIAIFMQRRWVQLAIRCVCNHHSEHKTGHHVPNMVPIVGDARDTDGDGGKKWNARDEEVPGMR